MALDVLQRNREGGKALAEALAASVEQVTWCRDCRTLTESGQCRLCADENRDDAVMCVVESPADILAIEQAGGFRGRYFVLNGRLSPIDGVGPEDLALDRLAARVRELDVREVILATNPTVEGGGHRPLHRRPARERGRRYQPHCPWGSHRRRTGVCGWRNHRACPAGATASRLTNQAAASG